MRKLGMKLLLGLFVIGSSVNSLQADLIKYVPKGSKLLISTNIAKIIKNINSGDFVKEGEVAGVKSKYDEFLSDIGLKESEIPKKITLYLGSKDSWGLLAETKITPERLEVLLKELVAKEKENGKNASCKKAKIAGKSCFVLTEKKAESSKTPSMMPIPKIDVDSIVITYLEKNVIFATSKDIFKKSVGALGKSSIADDEAFMNRGKSVDESNLLSLIFTMPKIEDSKPGQQPTALDMFGITPMIKGIDGGALSFDFTGKDAINLKLAIDCKNKTKAQMLTMMAQGQMMMLAQKYKDNPELLASVKKALVISNKKKQILLELNFSKELADRLKAFDKKSKTNTKSI
jgi:hypothetical protein